MLRKSILRTAADASADQNIDLPILQKTCQSSMPRSVRTDHFRRNNLVILHLIYLKGLRVTKMLKDFSIFIGYCNSHNL